MDGIPPPNVDKPPPRKRGRPPAQKLMQLATSPEVSNMVTPAYDAMKALLKAVRGLHEKGGRQLCELFEELVSREEYPDYYEVIHKPIALGIIQQKVDRKEYASVLEFVTDFELLTINAKTYNRKGSGVFKDAVALEAAFAAELTNLAKQTPKPDAGQASVTVADDSPPDPMTEQMKRALDTILGRQTDDGRQLAEMFLELPDREEYPDYYMEIKSPIALDMIRRKVRDKVYRSMGEFESDFSLMIANAMEYNTEGSDVYEDAMALQELFTELMREGEAVGSNGEGMIAEQSLVYNGETYEPGDFVYIFNPNDPHKPTVAQIMSIWTKTVPTRRAGITTCWFLRPEQTVHRANTKFMQNEVFKTNHMETYYADEIVGRCWVLHYRDYIRGRPKGAPAKDTFICESRYNEQAKQYSKIRNWASCIPPNASKAPPELDLFPSVVVPPRIYPAFPVPGEATVKPVTPVVPTFQPIAPPSPKKMATSSVGSAQSSGAHLQHLAPTLPSSLSEPQQFQSVPMAPLSQQLSSSAPLSQAYATTMASYGVTATSIPGFATGLPTSMTLPQPAFNSFQSLYAQQQQQPQVSHEGFQLIPTITLESFDATEDKKMKWFATPPLDVIDNWTAVNSLEYLYTKAVEKRKASGVPDKTHNAGSGKRLKKLQIEKQKASSDAQAADKTRSAAAPLTSSATTENRPPSPLPSSAAAPPTAAVNGAHPDPDPIAAAADVLGVLAGTWIKEARMLDTRF
ncbi:Bromodomain-containing protein [Powellomyces hirtus]|nr:Bromodomain-containing protein [Powellomyces hirtus]